VGGGSSTDSGKTSRAEKAAATSTIETDDAIVVTAAAAAATSNNKPHRNQSSPTARLWVGSSLREMAASSAVLKAATSPNLAMRGCHRPSLGSTDSAMAIPSARAPATIIGIASSPLRFKQSTA
jgi:hypothetical protein